jgi:hypothetical protein
MVFEVENRLSYSGMDVEIGDKGTGVSVVLHVKQSLEEVNVAVKLLQGTKGMTIVDEIVAMLEEDARKVFHLITVNILYSAK